jgi:NADH pyrophosphatase NudC (nudix superfamily)
MQNSYKTFPGRTKEVGDVFYSEKRKFGGYPGNTKKQYREEAQIICDELKNANAYLADRLKPAIKIICNITKRDEIYQ